MLKKLREPVNGLTHLFTAVAAVPGLAVLVWVSRDSLPKQLSLFVYGASLVLMFSSSAAYHLVAARPRVMQWLRKLDHSAIYVLIAGTYTPICLHFFDGAWRWGVLGVVWAMAVIGVTVKLFIIKAPRWVTAGIYLLMGWLSLVALKEMLSAMPAGALAGLFAGGLFFTLGAVVYITKRLDFVPGVFGFHEVWHIFVILGCLSHFIVIAAFVAPSPAPM